MSDGIGNSGTDSSTSDVAVLPAAQEIIDMVNRTTNPRETPNNAPPSAPNANELLAMVARLQKQVDMQADELAKAQQRQAKGISFKVSEKGGLSVYGLNSRFPTTLYKNQWRKVFELQEEIEAFLDEHDGELKDPPKAGRPVTNASARG